MTSDQNFLFYGIREGLTRQQQIIGYNDEVIDVAFVTESEVQLAVASNSEQVRFEGKLICISLIKWIDSIYRFEFLT